MRCARIVVVSHERAALIGCCWFVALVALACRAIPCGSLWFDVVDRADHQSFRDEGDR